MSLNNKFENIGGEKFFPLLKNRNRESNGTSSYCSYYNNLYNYSLGTFCNAWLVEAQEKIRT